MPHEDNLRLTTDTTRCDTDNGIMRLADLWDLKCLDFHVESFAFELDGLHGVVVVVMIVVIMVFRVRV